MAQVEPIDESHTPSWRSSPNDDDLIFDDGEPMESSRHRDQMILLIDTLKRHWAGRTDYYVGGNEALYFSATQARNRDFRAPDVFVVLNTELRERKGWVTWWEEGRLPDVIIELTSDSTRKQDMGLKKAIYGSLGVPYYAVYDPFTFDLHVYRQARGLRWARVAPSKRGLVPIPPLSLWLGTSPGTHDGEAMRWLRWFDAHAVPLPTDAEARERAEAERERAEAERERAQAERERAEAERKRAEAERERAEAERERAEAERQFLSERLAEYERRFGPLEPPGK